MSVEAGSKIYVAEERLYRTKDGRIVGADDPDRLTLVAVKGQRMTMQRAQSVGLVSADEVAAEPAEASGREDTITPMGGGSRADRVRRLTPAVDETKSMPAPEDKAVRKTARKRTAKTEKAS